MTWDMIIKQANVFQSFTQSFKRMDVAIQDGNFALLQDHIEDEADIILNGEGNYMIPGLVDIHMHIESSMSVPSRFSDTVLPHGVTTVVADPHEIANVFGIEGIKAFISNATTLDIFYGIPSSVPSTNPNLETSGGLIQEADVEELLQLEHVLCLGEVMNFHDLCYEEDSLSKRILATCKRLRPHLPIEGHCPKIQGRELAKFIASGVTADHTHQTSESIIEKINNGMFLEMQKKSISKETMKTLVDQAFYEYFAFVTDDVMADQLRHGHLNEVIKCAVSMGMPIEKAIYCSTFTPARRMHLEDRGAIVPGRIADFILLDNLESFHIDAVYKHGVNVLDIANSPQASFPEAFYHSVQCKQAVREDFRIALEGKEAVCNIIAIQPHATFTNHEQATLPIKDGYLDYAPYALLTIFERYGKNGNIAHAILRHTIQKEGAIATTWAHDHHNVMVLGNNEEDMVLAQNTVVEMQGGYVVVMNHQVIAKAYLEVGGIVSTQPIDVLGQQLEEVRQAMRDLGYVHDNEIMSFSTLSLPVSPQLKVSDVGMIDTTTQKIIPLVEELR